MIDDQNVNISLYKVLDFEASDWQEAFKGQKKNSAYISSHLWKLAQKAGEENKVELPQRLKFYE